MDANDKDRLLTWDIYTATGVVLAGADARTLRLAAKTLHRWAEYCCGTDGLTVERDDEGLCWGYNPNTGLRFRVPDREAGALRRIAEVCGRCGLNWYHQTDPRGWPLYLAAVDQVINADSYDSAFGVSPHL